MSRTKTSATTGRGESLLAEEPFVKTRTARRRLTARRSLPRRSAFVTIELPFVIGFFGLVVGAILTYRSGYVTTGAWLAFALTIPFALLMAVSLAGELRHRK